ncbi:MAG: hypothetical protein JWL77_1737 [Chthonomonadaceae bacterium]|nr:hypothetical protein [Chthonomonadaceae bacterium]
MNRKQKIYLSLCSVMLCLMIFFPPFVVEGWIMPGISYAPIWSRSILHPEKVTSEGTLCTELLGIQILVLLVFTVIGLIGLMDRPTDSGRNLFHR